jgi:hypothetical protein
MPAFKHCDKVVGETVGAGKRRVVRQDKVEIVAQLVALAFVGAFDVEQD